MANRITITSIFSFQNITIVELKLYDFIP